jgi:hypothetical protein
VLAAFLSSFLLRLQALHPPPLLTLLHNLQKRLKILTVKRQCSYLVEMAKTISDVVKELVGFIGEVSAIIHYFSDIVIIISVYNIIFEHGGVVAIAIWVLMALISAVIAELLRSRLPTPLRTVFRRKSIGQTP